MQQKQWGFYPFMLALNVDIIVVLFTIVFRELCEKHEICKLANKFHSKLTSLC